MEEEKLENLKTAVDDYLSGIIDNYEGLRKLIEEGRGDSESGKFGLTLPNGWIEDQNGILSQYTDGYYQKKYEIQIREIE